MMTISVLPLQKKESRLVNTLHNQLQLHGLSFIMTLIDLSAQKKSIEEYLCQIQQGIESVQEPEVLKRVLSLLMQANSSLTSVSNAEVHAKEKFALAQKNETQLQFKKTSRNAGRKKDRQLRYYAMINFITICYLYLLLKVSSN